MELLSLGSNALEFLQAPRIRQSFTQGGKKEKARVPWGSPSVIARTRMGFRRERSGVDRRYWRKGARTFVRRAVPMGVHARRPPGDESN